jgi:hypothetical protein
MANLWMNGMPGIEFDPYLIRLVPALQAWKICLDMFPAFQAGLSHGGLSALGAKLEE